MSKSTVEIDIGAFDTILIENLRYHAGIQVALIKETISNRSAGSVEIKSKNLQSYYETLSALNRVLEYYGSEPVNV